MMSGPDFDLETLGDAPVPTPRTEAMAMARRAALENFDSVVRERRQTTQGSTFINRLHRVATKIWSFPMTMTASSRAALAALIVLPVVGATMFENFPVRLRYSELGNHVASGDGGAAGHQPVQKEIVVEKNVIDNEQLSDAPVQSGRDKGSLVANDEPFVSAAAPKNDAAQMSESKGYSNSRQNSFLKRIAQQPATVGEGFTEPTRDKFPQAKSNGVISVATQAVSTFSVDVDTSGYSSLRRMLNVGTLPQPDAVRIEEMVNYFPYAYAGPEKAEEAFKANVTVTPTPWNTHTKLMHIGIKGYDIPAPEQRPANLVFLLDVSGSMNEPNKLPLVKASFRMLLNSLKPTDTISIVTYAGDAGVVLEPTKLSEKATILNAIESLQPGGGTAGEAGINAAYALAEKSFVRYGVNRILLATDGDFNVGAASDEDLKKLVEEKRKTGVFLSVLGFGDGNYQDNLMQTLAQNGNGVAAYIDTLGEAQKVLVQEATSSLFTIAKDVKIQVEFNPARVSEYRLIGYETRHLNNEDFNNDRVDAGDIGSGHTVTAIYEVTPRGEPGQVDPSRYQKQTVEIDPSGEYAFVKIRYKLPTEDKSRLVTQPVTDNNAVDKLADAPQDVRFAIAVSAFGQKLRNEDAVANYPYADMIALADGAKGWDAFGYRAELVKLVRLAAGLAR